MFLHLTTLLNLDQEPIGTVDAQFVGGARTNTFMIVATDPDHTGDQVALYSYGPFATDDDARAWAAAHLTPYSTYTVAPLATPYTNAEVNTELRTPLHHSTTAPRARADTIAAYLTPHDLTRLRHNTRSDTARQGFTAREMEHPELGPVVELTALGPDPYRRERDHSRMRTVLRHDYPRFEVTDQDTRLLVRRLSDAELHDRADQAAARVAPHLAALTTSTPPPAPAATRTAAETADALFHAVLDAARETASGAPDDHDHDHDRDLMLQLPDMAPRDALTALKQVFLPPALSGPLADALAVLAPHTYAPQTD
ncbi:hypothetical protein [Streptomyces sp. NPDC055287]